MIKKPKTLQYIPRWLVAIGDIIFICAGFLLGFVFRFGLNVPEKNFQPFMETLPWLSVVVLILFAGLGLYEYRFNGFLPVIWSVITAVVITAVFTAAITFWLREFAFPRSVLVLGAVCQAVLVIAWRGLVWYGDRWLHGRRRLAVIGNINDIEAIAGKLLEMPRNVYTIEKVIQPGDAADIKKQLQGLDGVIVAPSVTRDLKSRVLAACLESGREVYFVPDLYDVMVSSARVGQIDDLPVLQVQDIRLSAFQAATKRAIDLLVAVIGLVISSPLMLLCALLVAATSRGPVFYTQRRVGQYGKVFRIYKFRTMVPDAEKMTGPVLATERDPRITKVGRILRATRLDELPQLFNILKGEMSFVGPRPERPFFVEQFENSNPAYWYRYLVKPGITGLAQVYGKYTTSAEDKLRYDLYYIRNYSLLLDLKIILQTIPVVLSPSASRGWRENNEQNGRQAIHLLLNETKQPSNLS